MADGPKYLLGGGERLSSDVPRPPRGFGDKKHPYTLREARERLDTQGSNVSNVLRSLPSLALPYGQAVVSLTLHPSYLAKSYYPANLLKEVGLRHMGSRAVHIRPEKLVTQKSLDDERPLLAPVIYVAGEAAAILSFSEELGSWAPADELSADDLRKIERYEVPGKDRLKPLRPSVERNTSSLPLEVVLHVDEESNGQIIDAFEEFAASVGVEVFPDSVRRVGGLAFLAARAERPAVNQLLDFAFLRAVRGMPELKTFDPVLRHRGASFPVELPVSDAIAPDLAVAIFDGGLPQQHGLDRWVSYREPAGIGAATADGVQHGLAVTSAFLFGPLKEGEVPARPVANVDHWRVIGDDTQFDDYEILPVLDRIEGILTSHVYDFANISLGPSLPVDDDDVTAWTATLDKLLAPGDLVVTVACGNNGQADRALGLHRVQPPSDAVNVMSVGASTSMDRKWARAPYSACGPGRSPGFVKPDLITFGGSAASPFLALDSAATFSGTAGTSFASPLALRSAVGVRAQFREPLWAPTIKALMIHQADAGDHPREEVGWGCLSHGVGDLVLCEDGDAHIIYQRSMPAQGSVRMEIPVPVDVNGLMELKATFCLFAEVDPEDALNYTRAGLEVAFRPDSTKFADPYEKDGRLIQPTVPKSSSFFSSDEMYSSEFARREDAYKWETAFTRTRRMRTSSLNRPVFDVSYNARAHGHVGARGPMKIALVLTLRHARTVDLYDRVVRLAAGRLQPLRARPGLTVPARIRI